MTIGAPTEDRSASAHPELRRAEFVAFGLLLVEGLVILGYVAAAIANRVQSGGRDFSGVGGQAWGYTLSLATGWSPPAAVAVFILGPLALVAWIGRRGGDEISESRVRSVLRLELVLAVLTVIGGVLSIVGRVMQNSPQQVWSAFFFTLGNGLGSVCLGVLGIVAVRWLADDLGVDLFVPEDAGDLTQGNEDR